MRFVFKSHLPMSDPTTKEIVKESIETIVDEYGIKSKIDRIFIVLEQKNNQLKTRICFHGAYNIKVDSVALTSISSLDDALDKVEQKIRKLGVNPSKLPPQTRTIH